MSNFPTSVTWAVATAAELATYPVLGDGPGALNAGVRSGQLAVVTSTGVSYVLQQNLGTGNAVATRDDPGREWAPLAGQNIAFASIQTVANVAALALLSASAFGNGNTWCYVQSLKAYFCLVAGTQATIAYVRYTALNKAGFQWLRCVESTAWWSNLTWYVDATNGDDENTGAASNAALKTYAELGRRFKGRMLPGSETNSFQVNQLTDVPDTDYPQFHLDSAYRNASINITVQGTTSAVAVGTIASAVTKDAATNRANSITVTGFNFTAHVGKLIRLVSSPTTTAVIEATPSLGVAQLSERMVADTVTGNFAAGEVVEIQVGTKVPGASCTGSMGAQLIIVDSLMSPTGAINITAPGNVVIRRCELRGTATGFFNCGSVNLLATAMAKSFSCSLGTVINATGGAMTTGVTLSLPVGYTRHHLASYGGNNALITLADGATLRLNSDFHMFNLAANGVGIILNYGSRCYSAGYYYGSGNSVSATGVAMISQASYFYTAGIGKPVMDAGLGLVYDCSSISPPTGTSTNAGNTATPWANVPLAFNARQNSMVAG